MEINIKESTIMVRKQGLEFIRTQMETIMMENSCKDKNKEEDNICGIEAKLNTRANLGMI